MKYLVPENPGSPGFEDGEFKLPCDTVFVGSGKGIPYGQAYGHPLTWVQNNAVQNTWYEIVDAAMNDGNMNYFTHDGSGKLTAALAGTYSVTYHLTCEVSVANTHLEATVSISGTENALGISHIEARTAGSEYPMGSCAIITMTAGQTLQISIRQTDAGTPNISVESLGFCVVMVGG